MPVDLNIKCINWLLIENSNNRFPSLVLLFGDVLQLSLPLNPYILSLDTLLLLLLLLFKYAIVLFLFIPIHIYPSALFP